MNLGFSELISSVEAEIDMQYMPGAISWCDRQFDGGWSKAIDRFDRALCLAIENKNLVYAQSETEFYKNAILIFLAEYKKYKKIDDSTAFLNSIRSKGGNHG